MLIVWKTLLGPALVWQGRRVRRTTLRLPEPPGERAGLAGPTPDAGQPSTAETSTAEPLRVVFIGDSSIAGVGVDWLAQAMPQQAAEQASSELQQAVSWRLVARSGVEAREARVLFEQDAPLPADIAVISVGVNDVTAQRGVRRFFADYEALLASVRQRSGARAIIITGLPPLHRLPVAPQPLRWYLGLCATRLDRGLRALCASREHYRFVSLGWARPEDMARDGFHPGPGQYRYWAGLVADEIASLATALGLSQHG